MSEWHDQYRRFMERLHFDGPVRRRTWRKLAAQLRHDVNLEYALITMRDRYASRKSALAGVFERILDGIHRGESLDMALVDLIPAEEAMLIRGGYMSGSLDVSLDLCADLIEARQGIVGALVGAVAYPVLLLGMLVVVLVVLALHVVPSLALVTDPATWTGAAALLHEMSLVIASPWGIALAGGVLVCVVAALISLPNWTGPARLHVEEMPPWSLYRLVVGTMWLFSVATLLRADIQLVHILDDMLAGNLRPWLRERVTAIRQQYALGKNLGQVLADAGLRFPDGEMVDDLLIYAALPDFHLHLHTLASEWLADGTQRIKDQAKVLNTIFLLGIFAVMSCVALAVVSIQQNISSNMGGL